MRLTLLHFNDLHARLDQLPRLFTLIRRERAAAQAEGRAVLLFDGGDSSDASAWESDVTLGRASYALLEAMGVDAGVIGNNEAGRWGRAGLERIVASVHFPLLAANLVDGAHPARPAIPGLKPSCLVAFGEFKIGLIGVTAVFPEIYAPFGYTSLDPLPVLRREISDLKSQRARTLIVLSHLGYSLDPSQKPAGVYTDDDIAADCPEVDVILGGHTHSAVDPPVRVGQTIIAQAGDHGRFLGKLALDLDDQTGRVQDFSGALIPCDDRIPPDPTISATLDFVREEAARLKRVRA